MTRGRNRKGSRDASCNHIPIPFCIMDTNGFILECNDLFASLLGYGKRELAEVSFLDLESSASESVIQKSLIKAGKNVGIYSQRLWLKRRDKSSFPAVLNIKPIQDERGNLQSRSVVVIDDTFNYRAIKVAETDKEEMKRKERLKNEFVAIASHELRTPIQPILGFALLAKRGSITHEAAWEGVLQEARRLQQLANDILDVSRIESDNLKYEFTKVKINELITHAIDSLKTQLNKEIEVILDLDLSDPELKIEADRSRITQVITNIVGNALKFTDKGSVKVECRSFPEENRFDIKV
ncbi:MAG: sensor histidine kinase, partial [Nitrososphaera sp.]